MSEMTYAEALGAAVDLIEGSHMGDEPQLSKAHDKLQDLARYLEVHPITPETVLPEADIDVQWEEDQSIGRLCWVAEIGAFADDGATSFTPKQVRLQCTHYRLALPWGVAVNEHCDSCGKLTDHGVCWNKECPNKPPEDAPREGVPDLLEDLKKSLEGLK